MLHSPPRHCLGPSASDALLRPETCASSECRSLEACRRCACRACFHCHCTDPLGRLLSQDACIQDRKTRVDRVLGRFDSAVECRRRCNSWSEVMPASSTDTAPLRSLQADIDFSITRVCNTWSWSNASRLCVGHLQTEFIVPEHVDRLREYGGLAHGVATCAPPSELRRRAPAPDYRMAVLTTVGLFALSPSVLRRLALAHTQFEGTPHLHRAVLVNTKPPDDPEVAAGLASLANALSDASAAILIDAGVVEQAFPGIIERMRSIAWADSRQPSWLSNGCDVPGLAWYVLHGARLPEPVTHMWVVQHDIGWTGSLPELLARGFDRTSDLVCEALHWNWPGWPHNAAHNHLDGQLLACLIPAVRYSPRLLDEQVRSMHAGNLSYCEIRAATACARAPWRCRASSLSGSGVLGTFSAYGSVDAALLQQPSTGWPEPPLRKQHGLHGQHRCDRELKHGSGVGRLFHRVYDGPAPLTRDCPTFCPLAPPMGQCFADDYGLSLWRPYPCGPDSMWRCCAAEMPPKMVLY